MLKNVVFPAPLGPMIDTIERSGITNETSLTATRPPNVLETCSVASSVGALPPPASVGGACTGVVIARACLRARFLPPSGDGSISSRAHLDGVAGADALGELERPSSLGQDALRAQDHHEQDQ